MTIGDALKGSGAILFGLSLSALVTSSHAADATAGQAVFKSQCAIATRRRRKEHDGPSLFGVVGRKSGSIAGFHYSAANQKDNLTWGAATLEKYSRRPRPSCRAPL